MSHSTNSKPKFTQSKGSKAAIIRPVNRRSGKQTFVRIDDAQNVVQPNVRALELEDYVAQIRGIANAPVQETSAKEASAPDQIKTPRVVTVEAKPSSIVADIAQQQQATPSELTHADHLNVLQAVAKLDAGFKWIDRTNRNEAKAAAEITRKAKAEADKQAAMLAIQSAAEAATPQTTTQPPSQDLVNSIATAIASVLTDMPEHRLSAKVESGADTQSPNIAAAREAADEETLKLSPETPRPEYTLPVTAAHNLQPNIPVKPTSPVQSKPPATTSKISVSAAAWDVPAFRWPTVTDQILSIDQMMSSLTKNCESLLSPFGKTIVVTAPTRGQGTTTMTLTLARAFAAQKKRVLIVDGDIMQPTLSSTLGVDGVNWYDNHASQEAVGECIVHGRESGVCLMPLNAPVSNVQPYSAPIFDLLESQIDKVRGEFDLVVIDAGPVWQIVDEISSNSHLVDAVMLVNQDMYSNGFTEARERLMDRGIFKFIAAQNSFALRAG